MLGYFGKLLLFIHNSKAQSCKYSQSAFDLLTAPAFAFPSLENAL